MKRNRMRTVVMIAGVILSTAMLTAVFVFASSLQGFLVRSTEASEGDWYMRADQVSQTKIATMEADGRLSELDAAEDIGYARVNSANSDKPYLFVTGFGKEMYNTAAVNIVEGRAARTSGEIVIPEHLFENGRIHYRIGQKITLEVGNRKAVRKYTSYAGNAVARGSLLGQSIEYAHAKEKLTGTKKKTYRVVGICERLSVEDYNAPGYTAITVPDNNRNARYTVFVKTYDPGDIYSFTSDLVPSSVNYTYNDILLMYLGASGGIDEMTTLLVAVILLILLIAAGSLLLLYNAFSISFADKTGLFGMLSAYGATKKQIRTCVLFEASVIGAAGIPPGILGGIAGIYTVIKIVGKKFAAIFTAGSNITAFNMQISWGFVAAGAGLAFLMLVISAYLPAHMRYRVSVKEAMRRNAIPQTVKAKRLKTSKLTQKLFGFEGVLASKNFKRDRKRYRAAIISLFLSLVLFISANGMIRYLSDGIDQQYGTNIDYDIDYMSDVTHAGYEKLKDAKDVTAGAYYNAYTMKVKKSLADFSSTDRKKIESSSFPVSKGKAELYAGLIVMPDAQYAKLAQKNGIAAADDSGFIAARKVYGYSDKGTESFTADISSARSEQMTLKGDNGRQFTVKVVYGSKLPMGSDAYNTLVGIYTSRSNAENLLGSRYIKNAKSNGSMRPAAFFRSSDPAVTYSDMEKICRAEGISSYAIVNMQGQYETVRNVISMIKLLSYGFITLISLIAAANVFSTIATNMLLRRREFAMLQAVGMGPKSFKKMINLECIFYGARALLYGLPVSLLLTYLMYRFIGGTYSILFVIPWGAIAISIVSLGVVVMLTIWYSMHKVRKTGMLDLLKEGSF
jgi:putative ABC transport system permease protein